jgi:hypothetical protein
MRQLSFAAGLGAAMVLSASGPALADKEAGVPLTPADAAGPWTVETDGHYLCVLTLEKTKVGGSAAFALHAPAACGGTLPANVAGWTPSTDGMALVGADGATLVDFNRWSNSLFVSHRSSGVNIQLMRGAPKP